MQTSDFYYDLPEELIAQKPIENRDNSRLMVLERSTGKIEHNRFYDIIDFLEEGDCLILNDSKVLPARLYGEKKDTHAKIEILLLKQESKDRWEVLTRPGRKAKVGTEITFKDKLYAKVTDVLEDGNRIVEFKYEGNFYDIIDQIGLMPLPPYIKEKLEDKQRYQTVYSKDIGSAAAPTAGLHFTKELLEKIKKKGVNIGFVTLHVGLGTFRPVKVEDIENHKMHSEYFYLKEETAKLINETKKNGKRVIAVGTTSCRTLESIANRYEQIKECAGNTDIFIYPGYKFKCIDGLITNFHLPESTLIMLVSAFAGYENTMRAYKEAVESRYRFFSFGDAMFIR
ncbi:MAG: tRNA preQ1(34) S-adenosylmethionine ribosyltransferase-isomerase QueA [Clostridia bacterium]|nr:tRNA preQ1(34) S-adenosylmethionine ribosyltransferase-isomerase QueA [Clostridia bacterium]